MAVLPAGRRVERGDATECCERGFTMQPLRIVAGRDEECPRYIGADAAQSDERRRRLPHERSELLVESGHFVLEMLPALGQASQDVLRCSLHIHRRGGLEATQSHDEGVEGQVAETGAQFLGRSRDHGVYLVSSLGSGLDRGPALETQHPNDLHRAVLRLRNPKSLSGKRGARSSLGIYRIRLAALTT